VTTKDRRPGAPQALEKTRRRRPDLLARLSLSPEDRMLLRRNLRRKERTMSLVQMTEDKV